MRNLILLSLIFIALSCQQKSNLPSTINLNKNWLFKGVDTLASQKATIPGNVFSDLKNNNIIPDPFILSNENKVQWVSSKDWEYETSFKLKKNLLSKQNITLNFAGLDTYASIYLNDQLLGSTNNAFRSYSFSVKKNIKTTNRLKIVFESPEKHENQLKKAIDYSLPEGNRIFTRKAQFQYGWDWGPKLNTCGIWKDITLKAWDELIFEDVYIQQHSIDKNKAKLTAIATIASNIETNANIFCSFSDKTESHPIEVKKGKHEYKIPITIANPKLWWTHNLGTPFLYNFEFTLNSNGILHDKKSVKKGIRNLKLITEKDSIGASFYFELNGKPIYAKGANYIPQNSFQNEVKESNYHNLLSDVVNSNMNMLRVWGGGIYENDIFYDLCDEKGILVWQDFMFACAMYPGDKAFFDNVKVEANQQVKRLRNHASIALWCGNNENSEGWHRWGWQANRTDEETNIIWSHYQKLFNDILPTIVKKYSDGTSYWESSPKHGRGNPKYEFEGDAHDWWVWHDATPFEHFEEKIPRFMSEFGFQSFPSYNVVNAINQDKSQNITSNHITNHQKHSRGFQLIQAYMERDYKIPENSEDYIYTSQLVQAKGISMGIEAHRRAKPKNMGTLYWQLNDCWPSISWSSIDYLGNWKALQYKAKKAFKNLLISSEIKNDSLQIHIINDGFNTLKDMLDIRVIDFEGNIVLALKKDISVLPNSSKVFEKIALKNIANASHAVLANFKEESRLFYLTKPKNLQLKKASIHSTVKKIKNGFSICLKSSSLQKDVFIYTSKKGSYNDNFFDLLPNKEKTIVFTTNAKNLDDLKIKSLNQL
ncbi:beta-mannosidase [Tenacibaculum sp. MAR_2009_124]|uniref:beta-mannosidase n=1 Tax=Tenacibaculum sp. MAR_2009_124 TaxID=1250059 RepID=UPI0008966A13|nr:glycoside hydrolase family 2 protein [Tenacibaculum sp. MAR_2009_124]SEB38624.1 beta-mannosidase [Tenacibaculum sp. MAR_2009_124]